MRNFEIQTNNGKMQGIQTKSNQTKTGRMDPNNIAYLLSHLTTNTCIQTKMESSHILE